VPLGSRTVKTEPLPGSLVAVTSPPIMRASLRVMARPSRPAVAPRGQRIGLAEVLKQFRLLFGSQWRRHCWANYPVRRITTVIHSALPAQNRSWFSADT
jgi:hypothetical protein